MEIVGSREAVGEASRGCEAVVNESAEGEIAIGESSGDASPSGASSAAGTQDPADTPDRGEGMPLHALDETDSRVQLLKDLAAQAGVFLYDVSLPPRRSGVLQVVIASTLSGPSEVGHDQCNRLARLILDSERVEELLPGSVTLEVSSPGVNRELRSIAHLEGAVGERIRAVVSDYRCSYEEVADRAELVGTGAGGAGAVASRAGVIRGVLRSVGPDGVRMIDEARHGEVLIAIPDLKVARVDFMFDDATDASTL